MTGVPNRQHGRRDPLDGQLYDSAIERMLAAAVLAEPSRWAEVQNCNFAVADLADPQARAVLGAVCNVAARGELPTLEAVRAELQVEHERRGPHRAGEQRRDLSWLDAIIARPLRPDPPVAGWIAQIQRFREARDVEIRRAGGAPGPTTIVWSVAPFDDVPPSSDEDAGRLPPHRDCGDPRPEIVLVTDQPVIVDKAIRALASQGEVYVRGRQLVHVVRDHGAPDWYKRPSGSPVIVPIERDHLVDQLGRAAAWAAMKHGEKKAAAPPTWVAARILARGQWPLRQLEAISDAPVFRADGTIHGEPGYDDTTRVIFDPCGAHFATVPTSPTHADATRALAELLEPFDEFPFVADSDGAATAAFILSVIGRPAISGNVPMFGVQAPTPGSGKGLLADAAAMIPTGRRAPLMAPTDEDEETRKRLLAIAMESPSVVVIDNVDGVLGSPALAMALTAGQVTDRLLGSTKMVTASLRPVWCFTGNNVQLRGDLGRRVVPIDLDPRSEHPEDRAFRRGDLLAYVCDHRPRLVVAALTVLRAFVVAGRPQHGNASKGSFEGWDRLVRSAIIWAGGADPLGGVHRIRAQADEDLDRLRALLIAWVEQLGDTSVTLIEAIRRAGDAGDLHDAFAAYSRAGRPDARSIGNTLRKAQGRVVGGLVFRREATHRKGVAFWRVERIAPQAP